MQVSSLSLDQLGIEFTGSQSTVLYVNTSATGAGMDPVGLMHTDLGNAFNAKVPYDEVWVAQGTYKPGIVRQKNLLFLQINKYMGFCGTSRFDQRPIRLTIRPYFQGILVLRLLR